MTVSPAPSVIDTMCSETNNVTVKSIKVRSTSTSSPDHAPEFSRSSLRHNYVDPAFNTGTDVTMMSEQKGPASSNVTGECVDSFRVSSVSETVQLDSPKGITFEEEVSSDVNGVHKLWKSPAVTNNPSVQQCAKLVYQLSKELALLDGLSLAVGADADSDKLREEIRLSRHRACSLAQQNGASLMPLLRSKKGLKKDESAAVERLYRIYSGCLEYLVFLLHKVKSLLDLFRLNIENCYLIRTGITDPLSIVHKASYAQKDVTPASVTGSESEGTSRKHSMSPSRANDESIRWTRDIKAIQQLLCVVNNACDIQPWDVVDDPNQDVPNLNTNSSDTVKRKQQTRNVTFQDQGPNRRHRLILTLVALGTVFVIIIAVAITVILLTVSS